MMKAKCAAGKSKSPEKEKENSDPIGDCSDEGKAIEGAAISEYGSSEPYDSSGRDGGKAIEGAAGSVNESSSEISESDFEFESWLNDYVSPEDDWYDGPISDDDVAWCFICRELQDVAHIGSCVQSSGKMPTLPWLDACLSQYPGKSV